MSHVFILCQLLFFCSALSSLQGGFYIACGLVFLVALYHVVDFFFASKLHIRLRPSLFIFFMQPASFGSSAKKLGVIPFLAGTAIFLGTLSILFLKSRPFLESLNPTLLFVLTSFFGALSFLLPPESFPNPLYIAERDLLLSIRGLFKKSQPLKIPAFTNESVKFLSKDYPLLRITTRFKGDPLFNIRLERQEKPHIIFVIMESFRAKNVGCLGANLPLSPNFDALAKEGILFSNFHSTGTLTSRAALASLFGIPPAHTWWHTNRYATIPMAGLPQAMEAQGYHNALIQGGSVSFDYGIEFFGAQNYQTILGNREIRQNEESGSTWGVFDEHLMPYAASWLAEQTTPTFLTLFTITNHHPWISPASWVPPEETGNHPYLNTYAYSDQSLGILIQELKEKNLLEKSIVFIFGDHGQETPKGNPYSGFNCHLTQENVHIPLLIYAPGRIECPCVIDTVASQVDLLPTVLDLLHIKEPHHSLGKSLFRPSSEPIFFSHPYDSVIQGCRKGDWKFLVDETKEELYDLSKDKMEQNNVISLYPDLAQELKESTLNYNATLHTLYEKKILAPERKNPKRNLGPKVLQLDFSNCLRFDDAQLEEVARACPNLAKLSIANCKLVTDAGLKTLLHVCPRLESLNIEGLDDVTGEGFEAGPMLTEVLALGCHRFSGWRWLKQLYSLRDLHLESQWILDEHLIAIAENVHSLRSLTLRGMTQMKDAGLIALLQSSPFLKLVTLQNCPQITDDSMAALHACTFRFAEITDCPKISQQAIDTLASAPLRVVR